MTARRTYLDYNATAPLRPEAREAMCTALNLVGNPSSVHAEGRKARAAMERARLSVAQLVGANPADVVFTSGASEANAAVLAGDWDRIILSELEHDSVRASAKRSGAKLTTVPLTPDGLLDLAALGSLLSQSGPWSARTLLCLQLANNETGVIQPVAEAAALARPHGIKVFCDAVQGAGRIPVDCRALGADYLSISAHKLGGPKGAGALVLVAGAILPALIAGGGQERGRRAGTENVPALAGFGIAAQLSSQEALSVDRTATLRDAIESGIADLTPEAVVVGAAAPRLPNTTSIALPGLSAETAVIRLDLAGIAVSAGAACSSGKVGESAVLAAMQLRPELARAAIRISVGYATTEADIEKFLGAWATIASARLKAA